MTKEGDFSLNDDDDDEEDDDEDQERWGNDAAWTNDGDDGEEDVKDGSAAYLEFLSQEVTATLKLKDCISTDIPTKAQKLSTVSDDEDDLEEESLLETPLDRVEPYGLFKGTLLS